MADKKVTQDDPFAWFKRLYQEDWWRLYEDLWRRTPSPVPEKKQPVQKQPVQQPPDVPPLTALEKLLQDLTVQQAQAELARTREATSASQREWAQRQNELELENWRSQQGRDWIEQQRMARAGTYTGGAPNRRAMQAREFELWRERLATQLTGPANEVARWFVSHKPNPYLSRGGGGTAYESETLREAEASGDEERISEAREGLKEAERDIRREEEKVERKQTRYEAGPATPAWMFQLGFLPEVGRTLPLKTGLGRVETPSGQSLTTLAPSQSQYLAGAIDWFGGKSWQDILSEAELMQPRTPRGAGSSRWSPVRG